MIKMANLGIIFRKPNEVGSALVFEAHSESRGVGSLTSIDTGI